MEQTLELVSSYGYIILFLYSLGGGMLAIIAAGILSSSGNLSLPLCIIIASISNAIGDSLLFYFGRNNKISAMEYMRKKNQMRKIAYVNILVKKHGSKIIFFQKFIYGVKTLVPIAMGFTKYSFFKFNIINLISSVIWAVLLGVLSYYLGDIYTKATSIFGINSSWVAPLVFGLFLFLIYFWIGSISNKKRRI